MKPKVVFILLDAFRGDYINPVDTPFLHAQSQQGVFGRKMKTTAGFCQRTTVVTGSRGESNGNFKMFAFDEEHSPYAFLRNKNPGRSLGVMERGLAALPSTPRFTRVKRVLHRHLVERPKMRLRTRIRQQAEQAGGNAPAGFIPFDLLPQLSVPEDEKPIHLPGAGTVESIFDVLTEAGIAYDYLLYPVIELADDAVLEAVLQRRDNEARLVLAQFSDSDFQVHHCGPSSPERRKIAAEIDRKLREIHTHYGEGHTWVIIGDHGMTDVTSELDANRITDDAARATGAVRGKDYLVFLDSTMARWRWLTPRGEAMAVGLAAHVELKSRGRFVDDALAKTHAIPRHDRRFGDLIWWADPGVLVFPDYFHGPEDHNQGMHGYDSNHPDMKGFFLACGPGIEPRELTDADLTDVCPTLCGALGVRNPDAATGRSLID